MKRTKAQALANLQGLIIPIVAIALVLAIGLSISATIKEQTIDRIDSKSAVNEEITYTNNTYVALTYSGDSARVTCVRLTNGTNGNLIGAGNYTCSRRGILLIAPADHLYNTTLILNYTYYPESYAYNSTQSVQNATQEIPGWIPIIIITIIGAIVLSLVGLFRRN